MSVPVPIIAMNVAHYVTFLVMAAVPDYIRNVASSMVIVPVAGANPATEKLFVLIFF